MFYSFCVLAALPVLLSFRPTFKGQNRLSRGGVATLSAGIDVSGLTFIPIPEEFNFDAVASTSSGSPSWTDLSNALIIAGGIAYFQYERRPRGSARDDLVEIRKSKLPGGSLGVFSKKYIAEGTEIGVFPGYLLSTEDALASKEDEKAQNSAKKYFFVVGDDEVIDPTNKAGLLDLEIKFLGGLIKVDTMLGRVNEPPKGTSVNVFTRLNGPDATVVADRDIFPDEEIFMDCGRYDRAAVSDREFEEADALRLSKIRLEEEEMMTLRPITTDKVGGKVVYEQDTSLPDGFLRKLGKQDEKKFKKVGILSPEEGAGMFADLGNNMFGNKEDRDLIEGITGRGESSEKDRESKSKVVNSFGKEGDDEDLLASLRSQLGANNLADISNIPDILNPTGDKNVKGSVSTPAPGPVPTPSKKGSGAPVTGPSIFDTRADTKAPRDATPTPPSSSSSSSAVSSSVSAFTREAVAVRPDPVDQFQTPVTPQYGPALTTQEAEKLQDSLDDMTDDEVAAVLAKLRSAVSDRIKEEVSDAMMASGISRANSMPNSNGGESDPKKMPRAPSVNPEVREKFNKELSAIEDELEKIYSDPLGTWQEMMANPEKFLEENEIGLLTNGGDDK